MTEGWQFVWKGEFLVHFYAQKLVQCIAANSWDYVITQAVRCWLLIMESWGSIPGGFMWNSLWIKWHCRRSSPEFLLFHSTNVSHSSVTTHDQAINHHIFCGFIFDLVLGWLQIKELSFFYYVLLIIVYLWNIISFNSLWSSPHDRNNESGSVYSSGIHIPFKCILCYFACFIGLNVGHNFHCAFTLCTSSEEHIKRSNFSCRLLILVVCAIVLYTALFHF